MSIRSHLPAPRGLGGSVLLVAALGAGSACAPGPPPNVVLISIDSLRPDRLGTYGHERDTSPALDRLAAESVVFERAWSTTTWTLPSHVSMLTGLVPSAHGVHGPKKRLAESVPLLPELLTREGYRCAAVVSGPFLGSQYGFDRGWERYDEHLAAPNLELHRFDEVVSRPLHESAVGLLDRIGGGPFFLFVHNFDVHYDYLPPPPWDTRFDPDYSGPVDGRDFRRNVLRRTSMPARDLEHLRALYDGEIRWVDGWLERLFDELRRRDLWDRTLVIVTSDHGDEFLEHGRFGHVRNLYDSTLRVPLIVRVPGRGPERSEIPASLVDLVPTILAATGAGIPTGLDGIDLLARRGADERVERDVFAELFVHHQAIVSGRYKGLFEKRKGRVLRRPRGIYDLIEDPGETRSLSARRRGIGRDLRLRLQSHFEAAAARFVVHGVDDAPADEEHEAELRALGYL